MLVCVRLSQVMQSVQSLVLESHLDGARWSAWRTDLVGLQQCTQGVLDNLIKDAAAKASASSATQGTLLQSVRPAPPPRATDFRDGTEAVQVKYEQLNKDLASFRPYHPLSLTFYEPTCLS